MEFCSIHTLPFKLGEVLTTLKDHLKYIGIYYYERFEVYELTDKLVDKLFNHLVDKIELFKFNNILIGLKVYFNDDVSCYDSLKINIDNKLKIKGVIISTYKGLNYCWIDNKEKLSLIVEQNKKLCIHYSMKEYDL